MSNHEKIDIAVFADEDTVLGFRLAGVKRAELFDPATARERLGRVGHAKILIVTEPVAEHLRQHSLIGLVTGSLAEIPDKRGGTGTALKNISRLLEEAIGVRLKEE